MEKQRDGETETGFEADRWRDVFDTERWRKREI
jgi:hypothetical protein